MQRIGALLAGLPFVSRLVSLTTVDSTNDELRRRAARGAESGTVVLAECQTAGRGRMGRSWHSPGGLGLYVSILLRPGRPTAEIPRWTLGASLAACEACRRHTPTVTIDWPNDLMVGDRKLGGVLADLRSARDRPAELVLGVGLNVHHRRVDLPEELRATSLRLAGAGGTLKRESLVVDYLRGVARVSELLERNRWDEVASGWEALAPGARGRRVRIVSGGPGTAFEGVTDGVASGGGLRVRRADGVGVVVHMADSVRAMER